MQLSFVDREDAAVECEQAELQRSQLTDNIRALQEQKFHVDRLLSELTTLQSEASILGLHGEQDLDRDAFLLQNMGQAQYPPPFKALVCGLWKEWNHKHLICPFFPALVPCSIFFCFLI